MIDLIQKTQFKKFLSLGGILVCVLIMGSVPDVSAVNGRCGILDGGNYSVGNMPPGGNTDLLCDFGPASGVTQNPTTWTWTCGDVGDTVDNCAATISSDPNNGQCGTAHTGLYSNGPPTTELSIQIQGLVLTVEAILTVMNVSILQNIQTVSV